MPSTIAWTDVEAPALHDLAKQLRRAVARDGGFTLDNRTGEHVRSGVAVCVEPGVALAFPFSEWAHDRVVEWLALVHPRLRRGDGHLGGWHDRSNGWVWLDLVQVYPTAHLRLAAEAGARHRQAAAFDLTRGCEIWLDRDTPT